MATFIVVSILAGLFYCIIPLLLLFEIYHWITRENEVKYPLLKGTIFGLIIGLVVGFFLSESGSGEMGMLGGAMALIVFPISIVLGILVGCYYNSFKRTIFLKRKKHF